VFCLRHLRHRLSDLGWKMTRAKTNVYGPPVYSILAAESSYLGRDGDGRLPQAEFDSSFTVLPNPFGDTVPQMHTTVILINTITL